MQVLDGLVDRFRQLPPLVGDAALAAAVALVTVIAVWYRSLDDEPMTAYGVVLLAAQLVPLIWRRRFPLAVAMVSLGASFLYGAAHLPDPPVFFSGLLATYTVAAHRAPRISVPFALAVLVGAAVAIFFGDESDIADVTVGYFCGMTAWVLGYTARTQRERARWLEDRRADAARQAAADERVRIARDLHDVVAHHVSVIAVQAEAAQEVLSTRPERATQAMSDVADTARTALVELRRLLGVLRSPTAARTPQPDLGSVDDLVESVRQAGLRVAVSTTGEPRPVDAMVGLTAYRVVQEALTNVLKHAGRCRADVGLEYGDDALVVTVVNEGTRSRRSAGTGADGSWAGRAGGADGIAGLAANSSGQGLIGMRERVAVLGGSLDAGPEPAGGFAVRARLPLGAAP
jgi:signal transduction histidine kinase